MFRHAAHTLSRPRAAAVSSRRCFSVQAGECTNGRAAVVLRSASAEVKILLGGGHISSIRSTNLPEGVVTPQATAIVLVFFGVYFEGLLVDLLQEDVNPLWQPPWQTADPALRRLLGPQVHPNLP